MQKETSEQSLVMFKNTNLNITSFSASISGSPPKAKYLHTYCFKIFCTIQASTERNSFFEVHIKAAVQQHKAALQTEFQTVKQRSELWIPLWKLLPVTMIASSSHHVSVMPDSEFYYNSLLTSEFSL